LKSNLQTKQRGGAKNSHPPVRPEERPTEQMILDIQPGLAGRIEETSSIMGSFPRNKSETASSVKRAPKGI